MVAQLTEFFLGSDSVEEGEESAIWAIMVMVTVQRFYHSQLWNLKGSEWGYFNKDVKAMKSENIDMEEIPMLDIESK